VSTGLLIQSRMASEALNVKIKIYIIYHPVKWVGFKDNRTCL